MKIHQVVPVALCCAFFGCDNRNDAKPPTAANQVSLEAQRRQAQAESYDRQLKQADEQLRVNAEMGKKSDDLIRSQEETHKRADAIIATQEKLLQRQQDDFTRFEKILDTWEDQQKQYQRYLNSLQK